jgi:hypothetical protein
MGSTFFGGAGDQSFCAIAHSQGKVYLAGRVEGAHRSLAVAYNLLGGDDDGPVRGGSRLWPETDTLPTSPKAAEAFTGVAAAGGMVWFAGLSFVETSDPVGDKEPKAVLLQLDGEGPFGLSTAGVDWVARPRMDRYCGYEGFSAVAVDNTTEPPQLVVGGQAQTGGRNSTAILVRYDLWGNPLGSTFIGDTEADRSSGVSALAMTADGVCAAGHTRYPATSGSNARAALWMVDRAGNQLWIPHPRDSEGHFNSVTASDGSFYAAGCRTGDVPGGEDFLIAKYGQDGRREWSGSFGGPNADSFQGVVATAGRVFAAGSTRSFGSGQRDMVLCEIDPANGDLLSMTLFGGERDDSAQGIASDGERLFVCGSSSSFANSAGNQIGQADGVVLVYRIDTSGGRQVPGDTNQDGRLDISDPLGLLRFLFFGTPASLPCSVGKELPPRAAALQDSNGDLKIDLADPVHLLNYLFNGGSPHAMRTECVPIEGCEDRCGGP